MGRHPLSSTQREESRVELIAGCDKLIALCDQLDELSGRAFSLDLVDDRPRHRAVNAMDELRHGGCGPLSDRQSAQVGLALHELADQASQDLANDAVKQAERPITEQIRQLARRIREEARQR